MTPTLEARIDRVFWSAPNPHGRDRLEDLALSFRGIARQVAMTTLAGREQNSALRHLEEASFWARAAIEREPS